MITRIEALNYCCLRRVAQSVGPFHVLVGPNASGKSTFLDVIALIRDIVREDLESAISDRAPNYRDLFWNGQGTRFELALEARIPEGVRAKVLARPVESCRYELAIGSGAESGELGILSETLWLRPGAPDGGRVRGPDRGNGASANTILTDPRKTDWTCVLSKFEGPSRSERGLTDTFIPETAGDALELSLGPRRLALAGLQEDEERFPVATWFKRTMDTGVQTIALASEVLRQASPPIARRRLLADGSSFPWILKEFLKGQQDDHIKQWLEHVRIALPGLSRVESVARADDGHQYVKLVYRDGACVPSWLASHGTLKFLALTILPYLARTEGIYLVEEPENGIHPTATELVFQSLSSIYDGQVLLTTHSPAILGLAKPDEILCFARTDGDEVTVVPGDKHPRLMHWKGEVDLGVLFAGGVLG